MAAILAAALVAAVSLVAGGLVIGLQRRLRALSSWLLAFAVGTLLGASAFGLLPEALEHRDAEGVMLWLVGGILSGIAFEWILRSRHTHAHWHQAHHHNPSTELGRETSLVLLWGDALHNLVDGLVIGAAFAVSLNLGMLVLVATLAHELPQEIGDMAVLLEGGLAPARALTLNFISALPVIAGAAVTAFGGSGEAAERWLLPFGAGVLVYIALSDLVPALHHRKGLAKSAAQLALVVFGLACIWILENYGPHH